MELFGRFAADLGWHSLPVGDVWGWVFLVLSALAVIGLIRLAWRDIPAGGGVWSRDPLGRATLICILCVVVDLALLAMASAFYGDPPELASGGAGAGGFLLLLVRRGDGAGLCGALLLPSLALS